MITDDINPHVMLVWFCIIALGNLALVAYLIVNFNKLKTVNNQLLDSVSRAYSEAVENYREGLKQLAMQKKLLEERPRTEEANEIIHDLTAHGKAVVLVQRIGLDEILLRPRKFE